MARHKTSVSLEDEFWVALKGIAAARKVSLKVFVNSIENEHLAGNLSSAIRLFVLKSYPDQLSKKKAHEGMTR